MTTLINRTKLLKSDLLTFKNERLSTFSIVLLIIMDIFIFNSVMMGVEGETIKSPSPSVYYSAQCSKHFNTAKTKYTDFEKRKHYRQPRFPREISPLCQTLQNQIDAFADSAVFKTRLKQVKKIDSDIQKNNNRLSKIRQQYNTRLFEQIANMPSNPMLTNVKREFDTLNDDNAKLRAQKGELPLIQTLAGYSNYTNFINNTRVQFKSEKKSYTFWQPFYEYGRVLTFTLPLLLIFGFLFYRMKRKELRNENYNPVVKIISAHCAVILLLPIVWQTLCIVYHVIPKTLLKQLVDHLISIGLLSILNYLVTGLVVILFGMLIYFVQKRTVKYKQEKLKHNTQDIIANSKCTNCERPVDYAKPHCPYCGENLLIACSSCQQPTIKGLHFCQVCGEAKST